MKKNKNLSYLLKLRFICSKHIQKKENQLFFL